MMRRIFFLCLITCALAVSGAWADEDFSYNDHGQRDPFWPLVSPGGAIINYDSNFSVSEMVVEGIIGDGKGYIAIINGNIVEEGKRIGLYMVQKIMRDRVILLNDGKTSVLQFKKEE